MNVAVISGALRSSIAADFPNSCGKTSRVGSLADLILSVPFFRDLNRLDVARLVGALELVESPAGTVLVAEGEPADALYLVEAGSVEVTLATGDGPRRLADIEAPGWFGELGLLLSSRTATVQAVTPVRLWRLSRERFEQIVREQPRLAVATARSVAELYEHRERRLSGAPHRLRTPTLTIGDTSTRRTALSPLSATALCIAIPLALWWLPPPTGLTASGWHAALIVLGAAVGWLLSPLPDFVVAILMAVAWGVAGVASPSVILGGFADSSWVMVAGALGLAAAMAGSGLLFRASLLLLRVFPATHVGQLLALLLGGVVATPLVAMPSARVPLASGLTREFIQTAGYPARSNASAAFAFAALAGYGFFSSIFLTGFASNFFLLALLPASERADMSWLSWLAYSWPTGLLLLLGTVALIVGLFRPEGPMRAVRQVVQRQAATLGPLSRREVVTFSAVVLFAVGLVAQPVLQVDGAWFALSALVLLFVGGALDRDGYRRAIDWGYLTFFGVLLAAGNVLHESHVDDWLAAVLMPAARLVGNPAVLLIMLSLLVVVSRLVLPSIPARYLLAITIVPIAAPLGISPWVAGFVVFVMAEAWLIPSQGSMLQIMRSETEGQAFTDKQAVLLGTGLTVATLFAIALSIPYWLALGLIKN